MNDQALSVVAAYVRAHSAEAAHVMEGRSQDELIALLDAIPDDLAAMLLGAMEVNIAARGLDRIAPSRAAAILARLPAARAVALARGMRAEARQQALRSLPPKRREPLERLLSLRAHTVGTQMESRVLTLPPDTTSAEAIVLVRAATAQVSQYLYVVDRQGQLLGVVSLKQLLAGADGAAVATLMTRQVISLRVRDSLASARVHPAWTRYRMLPVVDERNRFAGILRNATLGDESPDGDLPARPVDQASAALGDLYRIGLVAMFNGAVGGPAATPPAPRPTAGTNAIERTGMPSMHDPRSPPAPGDGR